MGKQAKLKAQRKLEKELFASGHNLTPEMQEIAAATFNSLSGNLEVLTEELIAELMTQGWEEKPLREAQAMGLRYSRTRNSFWQ